MNPIPVSRTLKYFPSVSWLLDSSQSSNCRGMKGCHVDYICPGLPKRPAPYHSPINQEVIFHELKLNTTIVFSPNQPWDCSVLFITFQWLKPLNWITSSRCQPKQIFPIMAQLSQVLNEKYWFPRISCRFMCWDADLTVTWHLISRWKDLVSLRGFKKAITDYVKGQFRSRKTNKSLCRILWNT